MTKIVTPLFLIITLLVFSLKKGVTQERTIQQDSLINKIDSIVRALYRMANKASIDYDKNMPEGMYATYTFDTTAKRLLMAALYTYDGKVKKLTNFFFYNDRLIETDEIRVPLANQTSQRLNKFERQYYYWNETLIFLTNTTKEAFNINVDFQNARQIQSRFQSKLLSGELK